MRGPNSSVLQLALLVFLSVDLSNYKAFKGCRDSPFTRHMERRIDCLKLILVRVVFVSEMYSSYSRRNIIRFQSN